MATHSTAPTRMGPVVSTSISPEESFSSADWSMVEGEEALRAVPADAAHRGVGGQSLVPSEAPSGVRTRSGRWVGMWEKCHDYGTQPQGAVPTARFG